MKIVILLTICALMTIGAVTAQEKKSQSVVNIEGQSFYVHTVKPGQTKYSLSKLYDTDVETIIKFNPAAIESLIVGMVLKIPAVMESPTTTMNQRKKAKLFEEHIVNQGETAYSIAKRYGISITLLTEDNPELGVTTTLKIGQRLNIRKSGIGDSGEVEIRQELEDYKTALNSVTPNFQYHLIEKGDTFYSLSKRYEVTQDKILAANEMTSNDALKLGAMIKMPIKRGSHIVTSQTGGPHTLTPLSDKEAHDVDRAAQTQPIPQQIETTEASQKPINERFGGNTSNSFDIGVSANSANSINLSIILPLSDKSGANFLDFYQGAMIALEELKQEGHNVNVNVYDSHRSINKAVNIIDNQAFRESNLIIGPIYEDVAEPIVRYAEEHRIPVVSPLATFDNVSSNALYQLSPDNATKYDKLRTFLAEDKNVIVISSAVNDTEFDREISSILPAGVHRIAYSKQMQPQAIESKLSANKENAIVVLARNESNVDEILARISSIQNNMLARSIPLGKISVVGSSRWNRFATTDIDRSLFFKLNLHFISSYYADRNNRIVMEFSRHYATAFGALPTLYAYRGYDAVKLFVGALGDGSGMLSHNLNTYPAGKLLSMPYRFDRSENGSNINKEWGLVCYQSDYTINVL